MPSENQGESLAVAVTFVTGLVVATTVFVLSAVIALFSVWWAAAGYTMAIYLALIVITTSVACWRPPDDPMNLRKIILQGEEERLFKKHYVFFRFPFAAGNFTHFFNFARLFGLVWVAIALWYGFYVVAVPLAAFYLLVGPLMLKLYPIAHYKAAAEKGHPFAMQKLAQIEHILAHRESLEF